MSQLLALLPVLLTSLTRPCGSHAQVSCVLRSGSPHSARPRGSGEGRALSSHARLSVVVRGGPSLRVRVRRSEREGGRNAQGPKAADPSVRGGVSPKAHTVSKIHHHQTKQNPVPGPETSLRAFQVTQTLTSVFSDHDGIKLETRNRDDN